MTVPTTTFTGRDMATDLPPPSAQMTFSFRGDGGAQRRVDGRGLPSSDERATSVGTATPSSAPSGPLLPEGGSERRPVPTKSRAGSFASGLPALLLALFVGLLPCLAVAQDEVVVAPENGRLWVELEPGEGPYHPQEMIILRVRGLYTIPINLETLELPDFAGLRFQKIERDEWYDARTPTGRTARGFMRRYAIYPQASGPVTIGSFVHRLKTLDGQGKWAPANVVSEPVTIDVVPAPPGHGEWWLAAHDLVVTDEWSHEPESLPIGQSTRRRVTIRAEGVTDDQLPPMPSLRTTNLIVFAGAPERETKIGFRMRDDLTAIQLRDRQLRPVEGTVEADRDGPIATVTWTWDIRPATGDPVALPPIEIPWYDTDARAMRLAVLPSRTVALVPQGPTLDELRAEIGMGPPPAPSALAEGAGMMLAGLAFGAGLLGTAALLSGSGGEAGATWRRLAARARLSRALARW